MSISKIGLEEFENSLNAMGVEKPKYGENEITNIRKEEYHKGFTDAIELVKSEYEKFIK